MAAHTLNIRETHPRVTLAIGTLLKMIQNFSEKQMIWILTIIPEAYGDKKGMLRANLIRTLAQFIKENPDADRTAMIEALQRTDIDELEKDARGYKQIQGGTIANAMLKVLEKKYNGKRRSAA
jgi:hypothetical protein